MGSSKAGDARSNRQPRSTSESRGVPPGLWLRLPVGVRRQLAQQIAQLMQRQWLQSVPAEENDRADHDVVGR
jgi:hypothetical protein